MLDRRPGFLETRFEFLYISGQVGIGFDQHEREMPSVRERTVMKQLCEAFAGKPPID